MGYVESECLFTKVVSIKQSKEPESTNTEKAGMVYEAKVTEGIRDLGLERVDALRQISLDTQVTSDNPLPYGLQLHRTCRACYQSGAFAHWR